MFRLRQGFFQLLMSSQQEGWRGTRSWEGTQPGQLTQTGQQGIPYHMTSCSVYKLGGVGLGRADCCWGTNWASVSEWWAMSNYIVHHLFCIFQSFYYYYYCNFIIVIITIISFFLSVPLNCSYLNPQVLPFSFWFSPPSHWVGGKWASSCVVLSCWVELNPDTWVSASSSICYLLHWSVGQYTDWV